MNYQPSALIESYLQWWTDAGLDIVSADAASTWLRLDSPPSPQAPTTPTARATPAIVTAPPPARPAYPDDPEAFDVWLANHGASIIPEWGRNIVLPTGPANPPIMLITDYPDADDVAAGTLFAGEQGALLTAMLGAIGLDIEGQRLASIGLSRPLERRISREHAAILGPLIRHQIAIIQPRLVLALGNGCASLLLGNSEIPPPEGQPFINQEGTKMDVFSIHHLRMMLNRPQLKRHAWEVLKLMRERL